MGRGGCGKRQGDGGERGPEENSSLRTKINEVMGGRSRTGPSAPAPNATFPGLRPRWTIRPSSSVNVSPIVVQYVYGLVQGQGIHLLQMRSRSRREDEQFTVAGGRAGGGGGEDVVGSRMTDGSTLIRQRRFSARPMPFAPDYALCNDN